MPSAEEILTAAWRIWPAWLLIVVGGWLCVRALRVRRSLSPGMRDPHRALVVARGFRIGIAGLCLIGWAVGWLLSVGWVVVVALIILGEEMLETSTMIAALRDGVARARTASG